MPNIPYYTNPVFMEPEDNNNVTLIRAQRNGMWDYDKAERRHKSTNVLTYRVITFIIISFYTFIHPSIAISMSFRNILMPAFSWNQV